MAREVNVSYLDPLKPVLPHERLGPTGDVAKVNCTTCHRGVYKPLFGAAMAQGFPELTRVTGATGAPVVATMASAEGTVLFFAVGSAALPGDAVQSLAVLAKALQADPAAKVTISGYHSASGTLAANQELAKQRAFAVRDAITGAGIASDRVLLEKPQSAGANVSGEDPNARRVVVALK
jgi:photosynthetic reaction center cytochrome c subunit